MLTIVLQGAGGKMGRAVAALVAERNDCTIVAGIDRASPAGLSFPVYQSLEEVQQHADVMIDFSHPEATGAALPVCVQKKLPCVLCTTGLGPKEQQLIQQAAVKIPVFHSANMSLGINLLAQLARRAAAALPGFDIEIIEKHHNKKLDAPSGTALLLADAINQQAGGAYEYMYNRQPLRQARSAKEIGIHAVRGGTIVGDHDLLFAGPDEVITLSHSAQSRNVFANGAIAAALYVAKKPAGLYSMQDLMEEL